MLLLTIPRAVSRQALIRAEEGRLLSSISNGITVLTAAIFVLAVAVTTVMLAMDQGSGFRGRRAPSVE